MRSDRTATHRVIGRVVGANVRDSTEGGGRAHKAVDLFYQLREDWNWSFRYVATVRSFLAETIKGRGFVIY